MLGLAPSSPFWNDVYNSVELNNNQLFIQISHYPGHQFFKIHSDGVLSDALIEVSTASPLLRFSSELQVKDTHNQLIKKDTSVCLENSRNLHFQATKALVQLIHRKLCKEPLECDGEEDLNLFDDNDIAVNINITGSLSRPAAGASAGQSAVEESFDIPIKYSDLYRLDNQGQIVLNFSEISLAQSVAGCQLVFQQRFLMRYYLFLVRDYVASNDKLYVSFTRIRSSDFEGIGLFVSILLVLVLLAAIAFAGYIVYKCYVNSKQMKHSSGDDDNNYQSIND